METDDDRELELSELLKEVRRIEVQSSRLVTDVMAGGYSSVFRGAGIEFDEVREYVDGDDPRSVDWNVTARTGRPHVKKYLDERELTVLFLLDLSASMTGGFGIWSARQTAARVCACLALSAVQNNDKVGLIAFGEAVDKYVPPKKGIGHVLAIVRDCLALPASSTRTDFGPPLHFAATVVRRRAILFLVSDFLATGWRDAATACARRHDVIAVRLLTPELAPPEAGLMRVRDPESGRERVVDWRSARVRTAYAERVATWRAQTADELRRAGIDLMDVAVPRVHVKDAVARPILEFFRMRERRGAKR
ncbi:MAG: DUF58 domain-containing protein [Planctomycetes bacterium]|nr:DUF58 domain-containing protein [Planctomycetota bacterium]MBI3845172.1 DUF58 domain-containing protein [Planctomycetota bacterium]